jgi:hypothetical protein
MNSTVDGAIFLNLWKSAMNFASSSFLHVNGRLTIEVIYHDEDN